MYTSKKYKKETSHETDVSRYTFPLIFDIDVEKFWFFNGELKFLISNF